MDTIHFFDAKGVKKYVYTALGVYSRVGYALAAPKIGGIPSARFFDRAAAYFSFPIEYAQTDNGPEFGLWFTDHVVRKGVRHRHNHPRSPNEKGHLERFNRTIQEEMPRRGISMHRPKNIPVFIEWYNREPPHLALSCKTPFEML